MNPDRVDEVDELDAELDRENPEAWVPEQPGETLKGIVKGYGKGRAKFGESDICFVDTGQEIRSVWIMGSVLQNQFARVQPDIGERIGIRYLGKRDNQKGDNEYKDWKVVVAGRVGLSRKPNWDQDPIPEDQAQQEAEASGIVAAAADTAIDRTPKKNQPTQQEMAPIPPEEQPKPPTVSGLGNLRAFPATDNQFAEIHDLEVKLGRDPADYRDTGVTRGEAADYITSLKAELQERG